VPCLPGPRPAAAARLLVSTLADVGGNLVFSDSPLLETPLYVLFDELALFTA